MNSEFSLMIKNGALNYINLTQNTCLGAWASNGDAS